MKNFITVFVLITLFVVFTSAYGQWQKHIVDPNLSNATVFHYGDIDGDSDIDLVVSAWDINDVVWYENNGDNVSWTKHIIDMNLDHVVGVYVADIDGDDKLDVVAAGYGEDRVVWYKNLGGTPISWVKQTIDSNLDGANWLHVADIDGDNDADVAATGNVANDVVWYENLGGIPILWTKRTIDENLAGAVQMRVADINGDDTLDVIAAGSEADDIVWYENLGGIPIKWTKSIIDGNLDGAISMSVGDIDGDNDQDVAAVGFQANDIVWYRNDGGIPINWNKQIIDANLSEPRHVDIADINGDLEVDVLATSYSENDVIWYENPGWSKNLIDENLTGARVFYTTDIDNDMDPDVIALGQLTNQVVWYENTSNSTYQAIECSFEFEGKARTYQVYLPQNFKPDIPVIISLHGYTETVDWYKDYTLLHEHGDTSGFVTVYPQSASISWNTGETTPPYGWASYDDTVDDVGFISVLIDTLKANYDIDLSRVYCCGFSSGGEMAFRLAVELGHRFAAIGSVNGPLNDNSSSDIPVRSIPILYIHGTSDKYISYYDPYDNLWSVDETINYWVEKNDCSPFYNSVSLPDISTTDNCTVEKISYTDCYENNNLVHYKVNEGGHNWPSFVNYVPKSFEGNKTRDIDANLEILNFFKEYENPLVDLAYGNFLAIDSSYLDPSNDTLFLNAEIMNPKGHSTLVYAIINGEETNYRDSIELYDDGMHNDGKEFDNIYCENKFYSNLEEDFYTVKLYAKDLDESITTNYSSLGYFTTAGPIIVDSFSLEPFIGSLNKLKLYLRNEGSSKTITDVTVALTTLDTNSATKITTSTSGVDIASGETAEVGTVFITINGSPDTTLFNLTICSNEYGFWQESFAIDLTPTPNDIGEDDVNFPKEYALEQNYPNPFNPSTILKYKIPKESYITLKVYDILGRKVATLVNRQQKAGFYEVVWNAKNNSSGIYFYKIQAGKFVETKKMVLIR